MFAVRDKGRNFIGWVQNPVQPSVGQDQCWGTGGRQGSGGGRDTGALLPPSTSSTLTLSCCDGCSGLSFGFLGRASGLALCEQIFLGIGLL